MSRNLVRILLFCGFIAPLASLAQTLGQDTTSNPIITAVPFLMISPDARSSALGDAGAAISADANATHWNIGKLVFAENDYGVSLSYNPWLRNIVDDMSLAYLSAYMKLDQEQAVAFSLRYFNLGSIQFTNQQGDPIDEFTPNELALSLGYSRKLSEKIGLGVNARYVRSNLGKVDNSGTADVLPANALAADIGFYSRGDARLFAREGEFAWAVVISNIGNKITYLGEATENFMPGNLRLGTAYTIELDPFNKITLALDANKLLVPTPPRRNNDGTIAAGKDPNRSLLNGTFTSFADAPDGFSEEMKEFNLSTGLEYWYNNLFAGRVGYFWEHADKGGRKFFTLGVGLRYQVLNFDFAYLIPQDQNHPLAETLRFTLGLNLDRNSEVDRSIRQ